MAKTYYFYGHEGSEQGNAPHPEAHEQTVALITSSGSELVFQTHKDLGGVTYQIGAAGTLAIHDAGADKATVVFGPHAWFSVMGDVHRPPAVADNLKQVGRRSVRLDFRERFFAEHMSQPLAIITTALGAFGCAARAMVFALVGVFILKAAVLSDEKQTKGLDAVFGSVGSTGYGSWRPVARRP